MSRLIKMLSLFIITICLVQILAAQQAGVTARTRLSKINFKGNDFTSETMYEYDTALRINKIIFNQDGKLHYTIANFVFNDEGQLVSYIKTYNKNISPEKTTITYDNKKRLQQLVVNRTENSQKQPFVSSMEYKWNNDTSLKVTDTKWFLGKVKQEVIYTFNRGGNIQKTEGLGEPAIAYTNLFTNYDSSCNPLLLTGGYTDGLIGSRNNYCRERLGSDRYISTIKITYQKLMRIGFGGPHGPKTVLKEVKGLPLQAITTWYDPDAKKNITTGTVNYSYINMQ